MPLPTVPTADELRPVPKHSTRAVLPVGAVLPSEQHDPHRVHGPDGPAGLIRAEAR